MSDFAREQRSPKLSQEKETKQDFYRKVLSLVRCEFLAAATRGIARLLH
jgi:hypothetical protein